MDNTVISASDWWPSPAKLNLFLHILGRRADGYHQLQTLFQILDSGDRLAFDVTSNGKISLTTSLPGVNDEDNLIIKAARLLQAHCNISRGARITPDKVLFMGGGIGGGSSNAATTLLALNHLWQCGLTQKQLAQLGLQLGADVPIFIHGETAFASGVGESLHSVTLPENAYLIVNPGIHVSTAQVFGLEALPRNTPVIEWHDYSFERTHNDCQEIVCQRHPEVAKILQWLLHYAPSRMTGTGACVFATFASEEQARDVQALLPDTWQSFVAKGVNHSPLKQKLEQCT